MMLIRMKGTSNGLNILISFKQQPLFDSHDDLIETPQADSKIKFCLILTNRFSGCHDGEPKNP